MGWYCQKVFSKAGDWEKNIKRRDGHIDGVTVESAKKTTLKRQLPPHNDHSRVQPSQF